LALMVRISGSVSSRPQCGQVMGVGK
jgi:hypothetical protein